MCALVAARMKVDSAGVHKTSVRPLPSKALLSHSWEVGGERSLCCFALVQLCHWQVAVRAASHEPEIWCELAERLMFYRPTTVSGVLVSTDVCPSVANGVKVPDEEEAGANMRRQSVSLCCKAKTMPRDTRVGKCDSWGGRGEGGLTQCLC